jgi:hypothetical protein
MLSHALGTISSATGVAAEQAFIKGQLKLSEIL